jgi:hypothetical protein
MPNYKIIGGDLKQYGPITDEDVRKWIAEDRLNSQSLVQVFGDIEWKKLSEFPEFAEALAGKPATLSAPLPTEFPTNLQENDYELDIGGCIGRGWGLFKENMGTLFGAFFIAMLLLMIGGFIVGAVFGVLAPKTFLASPILGQILKVPLQVATSLIGGPLFGGIYYIFIQRMRGRQADVGDVFIGFQKMFLQLFLGNFCVTFFIGLCLIPFSLVEATRVEPVLEQLRHASPTDVQNIMPQLWPVLFGTLPILLACMIPVTYLTVNWQFAGPLIIDKQMKFWPAMKASWKKVHQHWWHLFGFVVVMGLLNIAGVCVCCFGVLFTAPISMAATMYAYETIFSPPQSG